jgi:hypothetical protein
MCTSRVTERCRLRHHCWSLVRYRTCEGASAYLVRPHLVLMPPSHMTRRGTGVEREKGDGTDH